MRSSKLIAVGGGEVKESPGVLDSITNHFRKRRGGRMAVMTVATSEPESAAAKYRNLFRKAEVEHVDVVAVSERGDAFKPRSIKVVEDCDAMFFTGGDQLNITSLMGGSPLHQVLRERYEEGVLIAGTSAGAAMMSTSMIISGASDAAPRMGAVEIAPGMDLIDGTIIDTHFSQRGRHGRLLTAVAHFPQLLGLGIDERTAAIFNDGGFEVIGEGVVTVVDGTKINHTDLPHRHTDEPVGMFGVVVHVLPPGYKFNIEERRPYAPEMKKMAGVEDDV